MQAAHAQGEHEKRKLSEVIAQVIHSWRYVLWTVLIIGAALLAFYFVYTQVNQKRAAASIEAAESVQKLYAQWSAETNAETKTTEEAQLVTALDSLVKNYPRQYGGQRGLFLRAEYYYEKKDWEKAVSDYQALSKGFPQSYLAPIALFNAGVCLEQSGKMEEALALYKSIIDLYKDSSTAPRALFDAGRISEQQNAIDQAKTFYDKLSTDYPQSEWTILAKNRIIELKAAGDIK